ncbi:thiol-disulfide oxidoreductase ResA [Virgibacillus sp. 179-BFC.A HS]|uniref:Thiol-disulfide oxidoreductase ResA n=1 Tax=Tigheibacillus jepli TaxID=3035914 RepID=A0ABU5CI71_9BACI|nr:thiol-disulfide oxidoreductase ResA [Virgibacillus sp. 179-BFC.A HS]MDY0405671.1 thiol-disulfide oxidoreductase ResA [Virgibacillus sp. 179-BFC.A HS]
MGLDQIRENKKKKKKKRLIFRSIVLILLLVAVAYALLTNLSDKKTTYEAGDSAPDFKLEQINSANNQSSIQLSDLKGKGVMLNFWATYCKPCEKEMPYMQKLYPKYKDKGVEIITVNLDSNKLVVDRFINKFNLTFPVLADRQDQVRELYNIVPIPSTFFIDSKGKIVKKVEGGLTLDKLAGYLQDIEPK